jgi:hypothetical protein
MGPRSALTAAGDVAATGIVVRQRGAQGAPLFTPQDGQLCASAL